MNPSYGWGETVGRPCQFTLRRLPKGRADRAFRKAACGHGKRQISTSSSEKLEEGTCCQRTETESFRQKWKYPSSTTVRNPSVRQ